MDLIFFVHIMKTGGLALDRALRSRLPPPAHVYPYPDDRDRFSSYLDINKLRALSVDQKLSLRYVAGHFPFCVGDLFERNLVRVAVFRDPVERSISHLRQAKDEEKWQSLNLIQIYEHREFFQRFIHNLQCRYFAYDLTNDLQSVFQPKRLSRADLERAKERVQQCEVIGLLEDFETSFQLIQQGLGLHFRKVPRGNASTKYAVPEGLRERIAADNPIDMEFYAFVRQVYQQRLITHGLTPAEPLRST